MFPKAVEWGMVEEETLKRVLENNWSPRTDLNRQPADYKSAALPLSYVGPSRFYPRGSDEDVRSLNE